MTSIIKSIRTAGACALSVLLAAATLHATEPHMSEYTHYPIFKTEKVEPRVMIVLDNSGSMNWPVYGYDEETWPNRKTLPGTFDGGSCREFSARVNSTFDDGWERKAKA
jgi:hypothetical protein